MSNGTFLSVFQKAKLKCNRLVNRALISKALLVKSDRRNVMQFNLDRTELGFFAELNSVVYLADFATTLGFQPLVKLASKIYQPNGENTDWLGHYFDLAWADVPATSVAATLRLELLHDVPGVPESAERMSILRAHHLARQYLKPKQHIVNQVNDMRSAHLKTSYYAVHFRGTDKIREADRVSSDEFIRAIRAADHRDRGSCRTIFVASDEQSFVDYLESVLPEFKVVSQANVNRSKDGRPMHGRPDELSPQEKVALGTTALVDCLLLSQGKLLIRSASILSGWASIFNPDLPIVLLNRPHQHSLWFPDRLLMQPTESGKN